MKPRGKPGEDGPFGWYTKAVNRLIREAFDASGNVASALSFYLALTEISSDEQSPTFEATIAHIAKHAGMSPRTANAFVAPFEELHLVYVERKTIPRSRLKAPSTYTLLPFGNGCASMRRQPQRASLPRYEECYEKSKNNDDEEAPKSLAVKQPNGRSESSSLSAENEREWEQFARYCKSKGGTPTIKGFQTWKGKFKAKPQLKRKPRASTAQAIVQPPGWNTRPAGDFAAAADVLKGVMRKLKAPKVDGAHSRNV